MCRRAEWNESKTQSKCVFQVVLTDLLTVNAALSPVTERFYSEDQNFLTVHPILVLVFSVWTTVVELRVNTRPPCPLTGWETNWVAWLKVIFTEWHFYILCVCVCSSVLDLAPSVVCANLYSAIYSACACVCWLSRQRALPLPACDVTSSSFHNTAFINAPCCHGNRRSRPPASSGPGSTPSICARTFDGIWCTSARGGRRREAVGLQGLNTAFASSDNSRSLPLTRYWRFHLS